MFLYLYTCEWINLGLTSRSQQVSPLSNKLMRTQLSTEAQASDSLAPTCQAASTKHTVATFNEHQILQTWFSNLNLNIFYSS